MRKVLQGDNGLEEDPLDKDKSFISNPPDESYAEYMDATIEETDWEIDIERGDDE